MVPSILFVLLLSGVKTEEVATPSSLLSPRNFNHHSYVPRYLQDLKLELKQPESTKQGPVLFPNDGPPPPRTPLIVTSRPLIESLARSELNPNPPNNSIAEQSVINRVTFRPEYLARVKDYQPFALVSSTVGYEQPDIPYADVVKKARVIGVDRDNRYNDYEERTVLPPIYKALADHAKQNVLKLERKNQYQNSYQVKEPSYSRDYQNNEDNNLDYNQGSNYAFSYKVKDRKTGDDFSHTQQSHGSATNGEYRVRLPDGRMQIVSYTADENGYKADVRYDDEEKTVDNSIDNHYNDNYQKYDNNQGKDYQNVAVNVNKPNDYNTGTNDYAQSRDYQPNQNYKAPIKEEFYNQYADVSKEYYNDDFSSEYASKNYDYEPHKSKFSSFVNDNSKIDNVTPKPNQNFVVSTVKPSYEELKPLFVTKKFTVQPTPNYYSPVQIHVPSTTPSPLFDSHTTERVVIIGTTKPNLYTNIRNSIPLVTSHPVTYESPFVATTPRSYLVSTIASLTNKVGLGAKPILSNNFINRINKYLSFN